MMRYGYYPGCSITRNAQAYAQSISAISGSFDLELAEIDDWNCCGATEYMSLDKSAGYALVGRNLALSADEGFEQLVAPCSACYLNLAKVDHYMGKHDDVARKTNAALAAGNLNYEPGSLQIRHLIDVFVNDIGNDTLAEKVTRPLSGLRIAPYYGCLIVRPELQRSLGDTEQPMFLDHLLEALGAEVVDFSMKTQCCGGHMSQISADSAYTMIHKLLKNAADHKADVIVTICPMCQLNLDAYQTQVSKKFDTNYAMPILYFTQMIGLALGISEKKLGIGQELVSAAPVLKKIGQAGTKAAAPKRRSRKDKSLPMPAMIVEVQDD